MDFLLDPITRLRMTDPVMLPCGHTYERGSINEWFSNNWRSCPFRCFNKKPFVLVPNWALVMALEGMQDIKEQSEEARVFLRLNSKLPFKPLMFLSYQSRQVHLLRTSLIGLIREGTLFGSTPREYRRLALDQENKDSKDGDHTDAVFSPETDVDIAFVSEQTCLDFVAILGSLFTLKKKQTVHYNLQGIRVLSLFIYFRFQEKNGVFLSVDLVYPDATVGLGFVWPDFVECQLACKFKGAVPSYVLNPLISPEHFFGSLWKKGNAMESRENRFLDSLLRHIDERAPWRWCLLRPYAFMRLVKTNQYLQGEAYELYVTNMLRRLCKVLFRGILVRGIGIRYCKDTNQFCMPCGHVQLSLNSMECFYNVEEDVLEYVCKVEKKKYHLFSDFF